MHFVQQSRWEGVIREGSAEEVGKGYGSFDTVNDFVNQAFWRSRHSTVLANVVVASVGCALLHNATKIMTKPLLRFKNELTLLV